jgi:molecular chaperone GrpE
MDRFIQNIVFTTHTFVGIDKYKKATKVNKAGDFKCCVFKEESNALTKCLSYLGRYGNTGTLDFIKRELAENAKLKEDKKKLELYEKQLDDLKVKVLEAQKKAEDYQAKFEAADRQADDWKNKYFQAFADMSNTRKQVERETADFKKYAKQSLIEEMLPALDGFDMALKNEPKDEIVKKYLQGFVMIHSKFLSVLKDQNVEIIDPKKGDEYDPNTMQAFSTVDGEEDNKIADVFTKGYKLFDHLIRPAGVIVTKKKEEDNTIPVTDNNAKAATDSSKEESKENA